MIQNHIATVDHGPAFGIGMESQMRQLESTGCWSRQKIGERLLYMVVKRRCEDDIAVQFLRPASSCTRHRTLLQLGGAVMDRAGSSPGVALNKGQGALVP